MIRAGAGLSTAADGREAAEEACRAALAGADRADAALLFATPGFRGIAELLEAAISCLGTQSVVGASVQGVLAAGQDCENRPAVAVMAVSGLETVPFLLGDLAGDERTAGEEIAARLGTPRPEDLVVLLPDSGALRIETLLQGAAEFLGPACVVGAGAADPLSATPLQWCGPRVEAEALAGLVLRAPRPPRIGVTQACRTESALLRVTRAQGNWVLELDGRPALDVYREVAREPLAADLRRAASFLLVALPHGDDPSLAPGSYRVRHVVGFAPEQRAFAVPEEVKPGQPLALALREPGSARDDMKAMLEGLGGRPEGRPPRSEPARPKAAQGAEGERSSPWQASEVQGLAGEAPALGLYLNCCARGASFFGVPGLEAAYLENAFGDCPIAGAFGSCEIGPIAGHTELLTYTGVLALLDQATVP